MVQKPNGHAAGSSQDERDDKQEQTTGSQLIEDLRLVGTVEGDGSSRGTECAGNSLVRGGLNRVVGA